METLRGSKTRGVARQSALRIDGFEEGVRSERGCKRELLVVEEAAGE
jgi:hypothetical protein